jgi:uncharacterized protein YegJ (DUF2314 family)
MGQRLFGFAAAGVAVLGLAYVTGFVPSLSLFSEDKVINVATEDATMNAAIQKARDTLPNFWSKLADHAPNEEAFSLKLAISDGKLTEHFWCGDIRGSAAAANCAIANEPADVHTVKLGQRVEVDPAIISDWMYMQSGKIKGGQTIRALIPHMTPEEADTYRAMLADE